MSCGLHHFSQAHYLCGLHHAGSIEEASPDMAIARQEGVPEITAKKW